MEMPEMKDCITWRNAVVGILAAGATWAGTLAWADAKHSLIATEIKAFATKEDVAEIKEIIVKCLIKKEC